MARKNQDLIYIRVAQNGSEIARTEISRGKKRVVSLSPGKGPLSLPLYPLAEEIKILDLGRKKALLVLEQPWTGYLTSKGREIWLTRQDRAKKTYELRSGDFANLTLNDLRLMIKVAPPVHPLPVPLDPAYKGTLRSLFIDNSAESKGLRYSFSMALALFSLLSLAVLAWNGTKPASLEGLKAGFILPFVHENSLKTAPEALQMSLDRGRFMESVIRFYRNLSLLFTGWEQKDNYGLFRSSVSMYKGLIKKQNISIEQAKNRQQKINTRQKNKTRNAIVYIPSVQGESFRQKLLRLTNKIDQLHTGYQASLDLRRKTSEAFRSIPDYNWTDYRQISPSGSEDDNKPSLQGADELSKINVFRRQTNEQSMYANARQVADQASRIQNYLGRRSEKGEPITDKTLKEIEIPSGVSFVSFTEPARLSSGKETLLKNLEGLRPEGKQKKLPEPLTSVLTPRLIEKIVKKHRFQLNLCYELALRRNQNLRGKMNFVWKINPRGKVYGISLERTTLQDRQMITCIRRKLASWKFPHPGQESVQINHSFDFEPQGG